jgi:hypothetical protein
MMRHEVSAEPQPARVALLMARFLRAVEAQHRRDAELEAALERLARRGIIRRIFQEIEQ